MSLGTLWWIQPDQSYAWSQFGCSFIEQAGRDYISLGDITATLCCVSVCECAGVNEGACVCVSLPV